MRLVTVNLYNDRVVPADLTRFLAEFEPDMLCGQEVGPETARVLEQHFPHGRLEPATDFRGKAAVALFPIQPVPIELAWRGGYRTHVEFGGEAFEVISAHLANPIDWGNGVSTRRKQLAGLEPVVRDMDVGVLVGDMNATPMWPAYARIRRWLDDGVVDWASEAGRRPERTWGPYPHWPALLRIDHVFTRSMDLTSVRVERIAGLDHRAVIVDLHVVDGGAR